MSSCSKAPRGLFVLPQVGGIFTPIAISPSPSLRQFPSRYTFHAGQNLPDKEFRSYVLALCRHRERTISFWFDMNQTRISILVSEDFPINRNLSCWLSALIAFLLNIINYIRVASDTQIFQHIADLHPDKIIGIGVYFSFACHFIACLSFTSNRPSYSNSTLSRIRTLGRL